MLHVGGLDDVDKLRNSPFSAGRLAVKELHGESMLMKVEARPRPAFSRFHHNFNNAATLHDHIS